jgi:hypothetical protein
MIVPGVNVKFVLSENVSSATVADLDRQYFWKLYLLPH